MNLVGVVKRGIAYSSKEKVEKRREKLIESRRSCFWIWRENCGRARFFYVGINGGAI